MSSMVFGSGFESICGFRQKELFDGITELRRILIIIKSKMGEVRSGGDNVPQYVVFCPIRGITSVNLSRRRLPNNGSLSFANSSSL